MAPQGQPATSLSEKQRQTIIAKLLEERRSSRASGGGSGGGGAAAAAAAGREEDESRKQRVQELIRQRATAREAAAGGRQLLLRGEASQDNLLSPHSTCSTLSHAAPAGALAHAADRQQQQQQQGHHHPIAHGVAVQAHRLRQAQQLAQEGVQQLPRLHHQPQEQHRDHHTRRHPPQHQPELLEELLQGPVDISDLWRGAAHGCAASGQPTPEDSLGEGRSGTGSASGDSGSPYSCEDGFHLVQEHAAWQQPDQQRRLQHAQWQQQQQQQQQHTQWQQQQQHKEQLHSWQQRPDQQRRQPAAFGKQPPLQLQHEQQQQQHERLSPQPGSSLLGELQHRQQWQQQQQQQHHHHHHQQQHPLQRQPSPSRQQQGPLPADYPASAEERLRQLAQPKSATQRRYTQMRLLAEQEALQHCSFTPRTGRGPTHSAAHQGLPASERLYAGAAERAARQARRAAERQDGPSEGCTFRPSTNAAGQARYLAEYQYLPIHERVGQVLRSKRERLASIAAQVDAEQAGGATFSPAINPRSAALAMRRSRGEGGEGGGGGARDGSRGRGGLRRSRSEADLAARQVACSFSPSINASSRAMLMASGEIPADFLRRQEFFERRTREKKQLLAMAVEDEHCCPHSPRRAGGGSSVWGLRSLGSGGGSSGGDSPLLAAEPFLDRLERLAYADKRQMEAGRAALAEQLHAAECTFRPQINARSARLAKPTPLQELYENSRGAERRGAVAAAVQAEREAECTFAPDLSKSPSAARGPPAKAKLSLSATEVAALVGRLHESERAAAERRSQSLTLREYQELKACTFRPAVTGQAPKQTGPVLVRGLGRFMELKGMARRQAEQRAAMEAKVFMTQLPAHGARPRITRPQPFTLGRDDLSAALAAERRRASEARAAAAEAAECTFRPRINSAHVSRRERVQQLLDGSDAGAGAGGGGGS